MPYRIKYRVFHERRLYEPGTIIDDEKVAAELGDDVEAIDEPKAPDVQTPEGDGQSAVDARATKPAKNVKKK